MSQRVHSHIPSRFLLIQECTEIETVSYELLWAIKYKQTEFAEPLSECMLFLFDEFIQTHMLR